MRKASHDGVDSTSITSGVENEKKSAMKPKKSSLKRKAPSFSQASDDAANEPLLQREKEKPEAQSAKYFGIGKTESLQNKDIDSKTKPTPGTTGFCGTTESLLSFKDSETPKITSTAPLHNYMNTNVFNTHDNAKANVTTKSHVLVEIDSSKQSGYSPSPLIFTTAKIHTDAKTKQMEPVHVTPVPILSTIEVSVSKGGSITTNEKKISNGSSVISPVYTPIPINKTKDEKVAINTVLSTPSSKDVFAKSIPVTSSTKIANNTTLLSSLTPSTLPSTTAKFSSMINNAKDDKEDTSDAKKGQTLPQNAQTESKSFNLDSTRNNVTVKTITPLVEKSTGMLTMSDKSSQGDRAQIQKTEARLDDNAYDSKQSASNIKTPSSTNSAKTTSGPVDSKQLQRQKTATEESDMESKAKPENFKDSSAKILSLSYPKTIDGISNKDNANMLPKTSANDLQNVNAKQSSNSTARSISNMTAISTTTKPTAACVTLSNSSPSSSSISSKTSTTSTISKSRGIVSPTTISKNISNVNKSVNVSTITSTTAATIPGTNEIKTSAVSSSISAGRSPETTSVKKSTFISKTLPETIPAVNSSSSQSTAPLSSVKNKIASTTTGKQIPVATATETVIPTKSLTNSISKTTAAKVPLVTTAKTSSATTKPSQNNSQLPSPVSISSVKAPANATSLPKTSSPTASVVPASQNISSAQGITGKQAISTGGVNATTKTSAALSTASIKAASSATDIKSPNNNTSQSFGTAKPSTTSIPKTEPVSSSKTSVGSSRSNISTASTIKSPQGTAPASTSIKESATSTKKPALTKAQSITKSPPVNAANKAVAAATTAKTPEASLVPVSTAKKASATTLAKTSSTVTSAKTSAVPTTTKASGATPSSSSSVSKPTAANASQVSANKPVGIAGSSVPSSTPELRPSESIKKGGSKSSENNKDSKVSKA